MTRYDLEQYRSKRAEILELYDKKEKLQDKEDSPCIGASTIFDYRTGYPKAKAIVGFDLEDYRARVNRIDSKIDILKKECREVEEYIESIENSVDRRIMRMYFVDGMSQQDISQHIHMSQPVVSRRMNITLKMCDEGNEKKNTQNKKNNYNDNQKSSGFQTN